MYCLGHHFGSIQNNVANYFKLFDAASANWFYTGSRDKSTYLVMTGSKWKHPKWGDGARREITCWHQAEDSDAWCQQVISRLAPPNEWVFSFYKYPTNLWNKQQVMSINLTTWSTMQYHVVVDHVAFYVIHYQVRYNLIYRIVWKFDRRPRQHCCWDACQIS